LCSQKYEEFAQPRDANHCPLSPLDFTLVAYERSDFERWYRSGDRVHSPADRERLVRMAVGIGEYMLQRAIRSVLDIGAGEGSWAPVLRRVRPGARYLGVEPSEYALAKYGTRRGLVRGSLGSLPLSATRKQWDLVVCCGVLNYVTDGELDFGLARIARLAQGVAYLELFASGDEVVGDLRGSRAPAAHYRQLLRAHGLVQCGPHCYVGPKFEGDLLALEGFTK
jgi:SAM-dependent methyltransferase